MTEKNQRTLLILEGRGKCYKRHFKWIIDFWKDFLSREVRRGLAVCVGEGDCISFPIKRFDSKKQGMKLAEAPKPREGMVQNERPELDEVFD